MTRRHRQRSEPPRSVVLSVRMMPSDVSDLEVFADSLTGTVYAGGSAGGVVTRADAAQLAMKHGVEDIRRKLAGSGGIAAPHAVDPDALAEAVAVRFADLILRRLTAQSCTVDQEIQRNHAAAKDEWVADRLVRWSTSADGEPIPIIVGRGLASYIDPNQAQRLVDYGVAIVRRLSSRDVQVCELNDHGLTMWRIAVAAREIGRAIG